MSGRGNDPRETIGECCQRDAVDGVGGDGRAPGRIREVARGDRVGGDRAHEAVVGRRTHCRRDAHVGHEAADNQILTTANRQMLGEIGPGKSVRQALVDNRFAGMPLLT